MVHIKILPPRAVILHFVFTQPLEKFVYLHLLPLQECFEPLQLLHHQRIGLEIGEVVVHPKQQNAGHLELCE